MSSRAKNSLRQNPVPIREMSLFYRNPHNLSNVSTNVFEKALIYDFVLLYLK